MKSDWPLVDEEFLLDDATSSDGALPERIAILLDENAKLRRIAKDLDWHNRRIRASRAELN